MKRTNNILQAPQHKCFQTLAYGGTPVQLKRLRILRAGLAKRRSRFNLNLRVDHKRKYQMLLMIIYTCTEKFTLFKLT